MHLGQLETNLISKAIITTKALDCEFDPTPTTGVVTPPSECRWIAVLARFLYAKWTYWPCAPLHLTFELQIVPLLGYPKVIPYIKFEHFWIICLWVMLRTNRQTNRRTRTSCPRRPTESAWLITNDYDHINGAYNKPIAMKSVVCARPLDSFSL